MNKNKIRLAKEKDLPEIVRILNQAIKKGLCNAYLEPCQVEDRLKWFRQHNPDKYPVYVYTRDNQVLGWLSISPYRKGRRALRFTAEVSYYVEQNYQSQGIGSKLLEYAISQMPELNLKTIFAILLDVNTASIKLLEKFGFKKWGHLPNIADFNGTVCGQYYYGYQLPQK